MFFKFKIEFGFGRKRREEVAYEDDDMPHMVVESMGNHERNPIGFSVNDPWERVTMPEPDEWEEDRHGKVARQQ